jgi:hypothetical protein
MPEEEPTVATDRLLLLHVPPATALESVNVLPEQTGTLPVIAVSAALTVTTVVLYVPSFMYVIVVVPAARPDTIPVEEPIVATVASELLHEPPAVPQESVVAPPWQMFVLPTIGLIAETTTAFTA